MFVSHQNSLYPTLLSVAIGSSRFREDDTNTSSEQLAAYALESLKGKFSPKHLAAFMKEIKKLACGSTSVSSSSTKQKINDEFDLIFNTYMQLDKDKQGLASPSSSKAETLDDPIRTVVNRDAACTALAVCAVARFEWSSWDDIEVKLDAVC
jgi:hypothetical protein